jgi:hypothetical protein
MLMNYVFRLSYSCLELRLDRIWWYSTGCMVGVLMSVGVMTLSYECRSNETTPINHVQAQILLTYGIAVNTSHTDAKRIRLNECAELATCTSLIWMRFGTSDHYIYSIFTTCNCPSTREKCPKFLIKSSHISEQYSKTC